MSKMKSSITKIKINIKIKINNTKKKIPNSIKMRKTIKNNIIITKNRINPLTITTIIIINKNK